MPYIFLYNVNGNTTENVTPHNATTPNGPDCKLDETKDATEPIASDIANGTLDNDVDDCPNDDVGEGTLCAPPLGILILGWKGDAVDVTAFLVLTTLALDDGTADGNADGAVKESTDDKIEKIDRRVNITFISEVLLYRPYSLSPSASIFEDYGDDYQE